MKLLNFLIVILLISGLFRLNNIEAVSENGTQAVMDVDSPGPVRENDKALFGKDSVISKNEVDNTVQEVDSTVPTYREQPTYEQYKPWTDTNNTIYYPKVESTVSDEEAARAVETLLEDDGVREFLKCIIIPALILAGSVFLVTKLTEEGGLFSDD